MKRSDEPPFLGGAAAEPGPTFLDVVAPKPGARLRGPATRRQRPMADPVLLPCRVTLADGTTAAGAYPPAAHTRAFLRAIVPHQEHVGDWLETYRRGWDDRFDRLEEIIDRKKGSST